MSGYEPVPIPKELQLIKTANEDIHARIRRARAVIGAGVRLSKPDLEAEGRADYAESVIENQILLYGSNLTSEGRNRLVQALFTSDRVQPETPELQKEITPADIVSEEEYARVTSDPYEYDIDNEVEEDEDE